ncbi:bifunctional adenosylcobinamide kinase/adenosylcobinamide-phosphate guanylyltransferase [Peptostreptococcus sp. D1]|uniref:bifunctional adenosylcobinamide kinase/adenosylcobinamide-phosphate guanylyltransferase n=1 Tax=Peptostreptococcus sp. D1 TaxID=72304 RepID=UPI0008E5CB1F|nr:bifunctional adenosylcobinamide kinase/adenosylcobinamide-phosphate guanylyltransferase [Peptostreptococcus sp. D1]SFE33346.1 adenosylcobinamide kinase /adenosylcobinamide-phosphate guanylyltransferase [Peptostreptococcus sp. D1]
MGRIIFVTGGVSSGKSEFAESLCSRLECRDSVVLYVATSTPFDFEMEQKKVEHQLRRNDKSWYTIEAYKSIPIEISEFCSLNSIERSVRKIILLDCVTMMISNLIFDQNREFDVDAVDERVFVEKKVITELKILLNFVKSENIDIIFVTNEIGLGGISENRLGRYFANLEGKVNKMIASESDEAYLIVSGIPIKIK